MGTVVASHRSVEIEAGLYQIWDSAGVSCFLIVGKKSALLMDSGYGFGDLKSVVSRLSDRPLIVVASHGHIDHVGGLYQFETAWIHPADVALAQRHAGADERRNALRFLKRDDPDYAQRGLCRLEILPAQHSFDLGERRVRVIDCPGHTRGSIALLDENTGMLLGADTFSRHIWLFDDDSTALSELAHTVENARRLSLTGIVGSHSEERMSRQFLFELSGLLGRVSVAAAEPFVVPIAQQRALVYHEGGPLFQSVDFLSIVFVPEKLP